MSVHPQRLADVDLSATVPSRKHYQSRLDELQLLMLRIQQTYFHQRLRGVLVFEGWDAAGKGGCIRRLTQMLDPRSIKVHAIGPPAPDEQGRHYLYRFWRDLPLPGHLAVFDRSWYGRVLVERVEKLARQEAWKRAFGEINAFEQMLVDDGVRMVKLFLHISPDEQLARFRERVGNPYKRWKISREDIRNRRHWKAYERAIDDMLEHTDTTSAPWTLIAGNAKWHARIASLERITDTLSRGVDLLKPYDESEVEAVREELKKL